jgi:hypothetical protein
MFIAIGNVIVNLAYVTHVWRDDDIVKMAMVNGNTITITTEEGQKRFFEALEVFNGKRI